MLKYQLTHLTTCGYACSHHQSSVCAEQCELACDWLSTPGDRVGKCGHTLAQHLAPAELEADDADIHSGSLLAHNQTQTCHNKHKVQNSCSGHVRRRQLMVSTVDQ